MSADTILWIILGVFSLEFFFQKILEWLQNRARKRQIPEELNDVYDESAYLKQQKYHLAHFRLDNLVSFVLYIAVFALLITKSFGYLYLQIGALKLHPVLHTLTFFGIIGVAAELIQLPASWYSTFYIEEQYGFNTTTQTTFWLDKLKGFLVSLIIGGGLLALINIIYLQLRADFWWLAWIVTVLFIVFMNAFYTKLILPIFNKLEPLPDGELRAKIEEIAYAAGFELENIYIMDGSKRSKKANAFFTGFGKRKNIVLFDTLQQQLSIQEIGAVLAHEIGHYKKKHTLIHMIWSIFTTGLLLWLFSIVAENLLMAEAMGVSEPAFALSLMFFSFLFIPLNFVLSFCFNILSRKHEFQADAFAGQITESRYLISALKKLTSANFSHLTPHKAYVFFEYSHPPLLDRIVHLENSNT